MKVDPNLLNRNVTRNRVVAFLLLGVVGALFPMSWFTWTLGETVVSGVFGAIALLALVVVGVAVSRGFKVRDRQVYVLMQIIRLHGGEEALGVLGRLLTAEEPDIQRAILTELMSED